MDAADVSALIKEYELLTAQDYCAIAAYVLFLYEWLITLGDEVTTKWCRRKNGASIIYFLNRYIFLIGYSLVGLAGYAPMSDASCTLLSEALLAVGTSIFAVWAAFSALRALALGRSRLIGMLVFVLSLVPLGINLAQFHFGISGFVQPRFGCSNVTQYLSLETGKIFTIISRGCLIVSDTILILVTWKALFARDRTVSALSGLSFMNAIILRDGTVYFMAMLLLNVLHLVLTLLSEAIYLTSPDISIIPIFTQPITCILVSHFLQDLQTAESAFMGIHSAQSGSQQTDTQSLVFARTLGSLASSINYLDEHEASYEGEDEISGHNVTAGADGEGVTVMEAV